MIRRSVTIFAALVAAAMLATGCSNVSLDDSVARAPSETTTGSPEGVGSDGLSRQWTLFYGPGIYFEVKEERRDDNSSSGLDQLQLDNSLNPTSVPVSADSRSVNGTQFMISTSQNASYSLANWFNQKTGGAHHQTYDGTSAGRAGDSSAPDYLNYAACGVLWVGEARIPGDTCIATGFYYLDQYWYIGGKSLDRTPNFLAIDAQDSAIALCSTAGDSICFSYNAAMKPHGIRVTTQKTCDGGMPLACTDPSSNAPVNSAVGKECGGYVCAVVNFYNTQRAFNGSNGEPAIGVQPLATSAVIEKPKTELVHGQVVRSITGGDGRYQAVLLRSKDKEGGDTRIEGTVTIKYAPPGETPQMSRYDINWDPFEKTETQATRVAQQRCNEVGGIEDWAKKSNSNANAIFDCALSTTVQNHSSYADAFTTDWFEGWANQDPFGANMIIHYFSKTFKAWQASGSRPGLSDFSQWANAEINRRYELGWVLMTSNALTTRVTDR